MNNILPAGTVESINQRKMGVKRTLIVRTIKTKYEAISAVEKKSKSEIARQFSILSNTMFTRIKNAHKIKVIANQNHTVQWTHSIKPFVYSDCHVSGRPFGHVITQPIMILKFNCKRMYTIRMCKY